MKLSDHQCEFLKDIRILFDYLFDVQKLKVTGTWLGRNEMIQKILVEKGLSKTMKSNHLTNTAIDLNIFFNNDVITNKRKKDLTKEEVRLLNEIGIFWENLDPLNRYGGFFKSIYDPGHFERNVN